MIISELAKGTVRPVLSVPNPEVATFQSAKLLVSALPVRAYPEVPLVVPVTGLPDHWVEGTVAGEVMLEGVAAPTQAKSIIVPEALRNITATCEVVEAVQLTALP